MTPLKSVIAAVPFGIESVMHAVVSGVLRYYFLYLFIGGAVATLLMWIMFSLLPKLDLTCADVVRMRRRGALWINCKRFLCGTDERAARE